VNSDCLLFLVYIIIISSVDELVLALVFFVATNEWPDCWTEEMAREKQVTYPWLLFRNGHLGCKFCIECPVPAIKRQKGVYHSIE
jgi:hypothetical protein